MIRWVILAQAIIYLVVMPWLRSLGELGYHPPIAIGIVAVAAFAIGAFLKLGSVLPPPIELHDKPSLEPRPFLWIAIIILSVVYDVVSFQFGLLNRRQGSEMMAEIYGTMPLWALGIIRGYEIIFVPLILIYILAQNVKPFEKLAIVISVLVSLPFMGISDSRGRIVLIALTVVAFFPLSKVLRYVASNFRALLAACLVIASFTYFSSMRSDNYFSARDYLQIEVFQRLDGLNIVSQMRSANLMPYNGTWDVEVFTPLISKIPFLEAAQEAKLRGQTSSKQYYLQRVLRSDKIDDSNSMITDPLYFGGILGLAVVFIIFGRLCLTFDNFVNKTPFHSDIGSLALALAFGTSFISFEADFVSAVVNTAQGWIIILIILFVGCRYSRGNRLPSSATVPSPAGVTYY